MVKKKSFWLTLLAVLTAAVLVFGACGLAACSSEEEPGGGDATVSSVTLDKTSLNLAVEGTGSLTATVTMSEGSYTGDYTWSSDKESVAKVSGNGASATVTAVAEGSATITVAVSDNKSATCTVTVSDGSNPETGEGSFTLQGYYDAGQADPFWAEISFEAGGTGYFGTYDYTGTTPNSMFSGDITWEYTDAEETEITAEMAIFGSTAEFPVTLYKVNGAIVAGVPYIAEIGSEFVAYEESVVGALESKGNVGSSHAQVVLYDNMDSVVVIDDEVTPGTWAWSSDNDNVTITAGSTYPSTSVVVNYMGQITQADFATFSTASDITFLPMGDAGLSDPTYASFVTAEGYTLVYYLTDDGDATFEAVVNGTTYTGDWSPANYGLDIDSDGELDYIPTVGADDDGNTTLTFATFLGGTTDVTFVVAGSIYNREDSATYQEYFNSSTNGTAVAVLIGHGVTKSGDDFVDDETDDTEYWMFLYPNGAVKAHIYDGIRYGQGDATWTWAENEDEELVPTLNRSTTVDGQPTIIPYQAEDNGDGTWTVHMQSSMKKDDSWYEYTFANADYPAGWFEGECTEVGTGQGGSKASGNTVYLVLYQDGTFKAHIGDTTSDGLWAKDSEGKMTFYKSSQGAPSGNECTQTANTGGTISVEITNNSFYGDTYTVKAELNRP